jgi:large subunit ribosomal protein L15
MKLHELKNTVGARRSRKRVARGAASGMGKTAGRGHKGAYARSGHKHKPGFEGGQMRLVRRLPKRGFTSPTRREFLAVNVGDLERFDAGAEVTLEALRRAGLAKGAPAGVKILGNGELGRKLTVRAQAFSASARAKIEAAGGSCVVVPVTAQPKASA